MCMCSETILRRGRTAKEAFVGNMVHQRQRLNLFSIIFNSVMKIFISKVEQFRNLHVTLLINDNRSGYIVNRCRLLIGLIKFF